MLVDIYCVLGFIPTNYIEEIKEASQQPVVPRLHVLKQIVQNNQAAKKEEIQTPKSKTPQTPTEQQKRESKGKPTIVHHVHINSSGNQTETNSKRNTISSNEIISPRQSQGRIFSRLSKIIPSLSTPRRETIMVSPRMATNNIDNIRNLWRQMEEKNKEEKRKSMYHIKEHQQKQESQPDNPTSPLHQPKRLSVKTFTKLENKLNQLKQEGQPQTNGGRGVSNNSFPELEKFISEDFDKHSSIDETMSPKRIPTKTRTDTISPSEPDKKRVKVKIKTQMSHQHLEAIALIQTRFRTYKNKMRFRGKNN